MMIYTVTLNPSLDRTLSVPQLRPGTIHRARLVRSDLGGKGVNVSRALRALGISSRIVGFSGGRTGEALRQGLKAEGFDLSLVDVGDEIRQNVTLLDEASGQYTKLNEAGPSVDEKHIAKLEKLVSRLVHHDDLWAFCGSLPPGAPADLYARLIRLVQARGGQAFLDTSGAPLQEGKAAHPYALKINTEEAGELLGRELKEDSEICGVAGDFVGEGTRLVMLTRGAQGAVLAMNGETVTAIPPDVPAASPVGAGDAALAGLLWAVEDHCDLAVTARRAVACGTAAAMQTGTGVGERALVEELIKQIRSSEL